MMNMIDDRTCATALLISKVLFRSCLIGFVLLGLFALATLSLTDQIYEVHSSLIEIPRLEYNTLMFTWLGQMKLWLTVFFLVPAIALRWTVGASR